MKREKVKCPNGAKLQVMTNLRAQLPIQLPNVNHTDDIDGIRIDLIDGSWILARPSGTEPLIRITVEARTVKESEDLLAKSRSIVEEQVRAIAQ